MKDIKILVEKISLSFQNKVRSSFSSRLKSFYLVGSYAFGKISEQRPDINFLLIFDKFVTPQDFLTLGKICRSLEKEFSKAVTIKIEFRPFRYIKPKYKNEFEVSVNPILVGTGEIQEMGGVLFNKWFTEGLRSVNKLLFGSDFLETLKIAEITKEDVVKGAMFDLMFFTMPTSRAPAQYWDDESNLLLNESLENAKNIAYLGIVAVMNMEELKKKSYVDYIKNKERIFGLYKERYVDEAAGMIKRIFQIREQYLKFKNNPGVAEEVFAIALNLASVVRSKVFEEVRPGNYGKTS